MRQDTPYFSVIKMRFQVIYETNINYEATIKKLRRSSHVENGFPTQKGHFSVKFRGYRYQVLIAHTGIIQVTYTCTEEKEQLVPLLKLHLVTEHNQPLKFVPLDESIYNIGYPPPKDFVFSFCEERMRYVKEIVPNPLRDFMVAVEEVQRLVERQTGLPELPKIT